MEGSIGFIGTLTGDISGDGGGGVTPHVTATAQLDANTGTPTVTVTRTGTDENPNFNFAFQNLKGETGAQGIQGIQGLPGSQGIPGERGPRGFTGNTGETGPQGEPGESPVVSATASIDSSIGTPSVSVTKTGPELSPNFAFSFHNLKGEPGADSTVPGPEGPEGPVGPAGAGLAPGGSVGQILYKNGADDYLTDWEDLTADKVDYDNTDSGLTATDAQGAIDEINSSLTQKADSILFGNFQIMENLDNDDSGNTMTTTKDYRGGTNLYAIACVIPTTAVARAICFAIFNVTSTTLNIAQFGDRTISGTVNSSGQITFNFGGQYKHATIYRIR